MVTRLRTLAATLACAAFLAACGSKGDLVLPKAPAAKPAASSSTAPAPAPKP